jgi:hypothetical protein
MVPGVRDIELARTTWKNDDLTGAGKCTITGSGISLILKTNPAITTVATTTSFIKTNRYAITSGRFLKKRSSC